MSNCDTVVIRYYGSSHPTEDMSRDNMRYLSSRQALEDAAHFISTMNTQHNLTTWFTFGGSYPGSLSAWMRLRFPHLVFGAVSSSSPLFAKLDFHEYLQVKTSTTLLISCYLVRSVGGDGCPRVDWHRRVQCSIPDISEDGRDHAHE